MSFHVAKKVLVTNSYSTLVTTGYFESQPRKRPQAPALPTRQTAGLHHCRSCALFGLQTLREQPFYTCRMYSLDLWGFLHTLLYLSSNLSCRTSIFPQNQCVKRYSHIESAAITCHSHPRFSTCCPVELDGKTGASLKYERPAQVL